jgi:hypothetical protein
MLAALRIILGLSFSLVAAMMLAAPHFWYVTFPGVAERGGFNPHFVRDIGCASLVAGAGFVAGGIRPSHYRPAMIAGAALIALHALVHVLEEIAGAHGRSFLTPDLPTVYLPAALGLWLAFAGSQNGASMNRPAASRQA